MFFLSPWRYTGAAPWKQTINIYNTDFVLLITKIAKVKVLCVITTLRNSGIHEKGIIILLTVLPFMEPDCRVQKIWLLDHTLSDESSTHPYKLLSWDHFNSIPSSACKTSCMHFSSPMHATCPAYHILLDLITQWYLQDTIMIKNGVFMVWCIIT